MRSFRIAAGTAAGLAFALAVLGSWVRINGAGMTCPDWPLCRGALVPELVGGVVLEWTHRLVAVTVGIAIAAAFVLGWRLRRSIAGLAPTLGALVAIFVLQIAVGGITIHESNSPRSVVLHWAVAMALLANLVLLAMLAFLAPKPGTGVPAVRQGAPFTPLAAAALLAYVTMCLGSYVSSSGAGLACATVPACDGSVFGTTGPQLAQMLHRIAAAAFLLIALFAAGVAARSPMPRVRGWALAGALLALAQVGLGVANVLARMPTLLREAHAANAAVTFLVFAVAAYLALLDPLPELTLSAGTGLSTRRAV